MQDLEKVLDSCPNLAWIKDKKERLVYVNQTYLDVLGKQREDIIGKTEQEALGGAISDGVFLLNEKQYYFEVNEVEWKEEDPLVGKMGVAYEATTEEYLHRVVQNVIMRELAKIQSHINMEDIEIIKDALKVWEKYFFTSITPAGKQIFLCCEEEKKMEIAFQDGICLEWQETDCVWSDQCVSQRSDEELYYKNRVRRVEDIAHEGYRVWLTSKGIHSEMSCMIPFGEELVGMIRLYFTEKQPIYLEGKVSYMREVTKNLGIIIKNMMVSRQVTKQMRKTESRKMQLESYFELTTDYIGIIAEGSLNVTPLTKSWDTKRMRQFGMAHRLVNKQILEGCEEARQSGEMQEKEITYEEERGSFTVVWQMRYISQEQHYLVWGRDITGRKALEQKRASLEEQMEKEKINRELLKHMSMWFEKPIQSIQEELRQLEDLKLSCKQDYVEMIRSNTKRIQKMLKHIIASEREQYEEESMQYILCDLVQEVREIVESMQMYVSNYQKRISFVSEVGTLIIHFDIEKLENILINLISNALKYTKEGECITVYLRTEGDEIHLHVMDNGEGIAAERLESIFHRFNQQDLDKNKQKEGSGIGLSTVKKFVSLHSGVIEARSRWGTGTEMLMRFPRNLSDAIEQGQGETHLSKTYLKVYGGSAYEALQ